MANAREPIAWDDARIFLAVARAGSIAAAGKQLAIDHATVSRRLVAFERAVGLPLVARTRQGVHLTDEGAAILAIAARAEEPMLELQRHRDATHAAGTVRMATSSILSTGLLARHVPQFRRENPKLQLELIVGRGLVDLTRREAEVALRLRPPGRAAGEPSIVATKLADVGFALYGTGEQTRLRVRRFIRYVGYEPAADRIQAEAEGTETSVFVDDVPTAMALARAGCGITILPCFLGDSEQQLTRASEVLESHRLYVVTTEELRRAPRVQHVLRWLKGLTTAERARLAGE